MSAIWKQEATLDGLNAFSRQTMVEHLGIEFIEIGDDYLRARMPVDERTVQPMRLLHGGASVALAETMGSIGSFLCIEDVSRYTSVGIDINASHVNSVDRGYVYATARPLRLGRRMQFWEIRIIDERDRLICVSRITIAVVEQR